MQLQPIIDSPTRPTGDGRWKRRAIAALLGVTLLAGCSTLRLGYSQGSTLAYWWLDRYVDFDASQTPAVRQALERWFDWHRQTQLGEDVRLLEQAAREIELDGGSTQACHWLRTAQKRRDLYAQQALPAVAELVSQLSPQQLQHLRHRFAEQDEDWREQNLQPDPAERRAAALEKVVDRAQMLYGRLDAGQKRFLAERLRSSPWDPERWLLERQRRAGDTVDTFRLLQGTEMTPLQQREVLNQWLLRATRPVDPQTQAHLDELSTAQCSLAADLHNRTSTEQRRHAQGVLRGWAQDLRGFLPMKAAATATSR